MLGWSLASSEGKSPKLKKAAEAYGSYVFALFLLAGLAVGTIEEFRCV